MARRATYFFDVHKTSAPRILVSGAWEYMRPGAEAPPPSILTSIANALEFMHYDVGFLSSKEADILNRQAVKPPPWQTDSRSHPFTVITTSSGDKIGFMRFPPLPSGKNAPTKSLLRKIDREIRQHLPNVRLLVALSDWGWVGEIEYLTESSGPVPHILLGSGRGSGVNGRILADGKCLWIRPYDSGRALAEVLVYELPEPHNSFAWKAARNYKSTSIGLHDRIKDNLTVREILQ